MYWWQGWNNGFFSKLLANVSFGKFFITKTFCRFFPPTFLHHYKNALSFFFPPHFLLRPLEHGTLCVGLPQVSAAGGLSSSRCLDVEGQPVIALWWANPCLLGIKKCSFTLFLECPWSHCFNGDVSLSTYWEGRSYKLMRLFLHPCQSCYCWSLATSCTVFFKGC